MTNMNGISVGWVKTNVAFLSIGRRSLNLSIWYSFISNCIILDCKTYKNTEYNIALFVIGFDCW